MKVLHRTAGEPSGCSPDAPGDDHLYAVTAKIPSSHEIMLEQAARVAGLGYFVFDTGRQIVELCSERHAAIFGMSPAEFLKSVTGLNGKLSMMNSDDIATVRAAYGRLKRGESIEMEYRFRRPDGSEGWIREFVAPHFGEDGTVTKGLGSSLDITGAKMAEDRALAAHRLATVGELTAGVAHDINNLLMIIQGNAEALEAERLDLQASACLSAIIEAVDRGENLTQSLLSFAQRAPIEPKLVELSNELRGTVALFERAARKSVKLDFNAASEPLTVHVDVNGLRRVILNVLLNAREASPNGRIEVVTFATNVDSAEFDDRLMTPSPVPCAAFEIRDDGCGIAPDLLPRVVEPFFTTKNRTNGSGLGLSMVQGFAKQSGGLLKITSELGSGTCVRIVFPLAQGSATLDEAPEGQTPPMRLKAKSILLLEDDPDVAMVTKRVLTNAGAEVTVLQTGEDAICAVRTGQRFDVIVLDHILPGSLDGIEVAGRLKQLYPQIPLIMLSGFIDDMARTRLEAHGAVTTILKKPVSAGNLRNAVDACLKLS